jgi:hypothetical protein
MELRVREQSQRVVVDNVVVLADTIPIANDEHHVLAAAIATSCKLRTARC